MQLRWVFGIRGLRVFRVQILYFCHFQVLTRTDVAVEHTASGVDPDVAEGTSVTAHGFRAAVWENWLLGMTDVQVISYGSGFGRSAAFRCDSMAPCGGVAHPP